MASRVLPQRRRRTCWNGTTLPGVEPGECARAVLDDRVGVVVRGGRGGRGAAGPPEEVKEADDGTSSMLGDVGFAPGVEPDREDAVALVVGGAEAGAGLEKNDYARNVACLDGYDMGKACDSCVVDSSLEPSDKGNWQSFIRLA